MLLMNCVAVDQELLGQVAEEKVRVRFTEAQRYCHSQVCVAHESCGCGPGAAGSGCRGKGVCVILKHKAAATAKYVSLMNCVAVDQELLGQIAEEVFVRYTEAQSCCHSQICIPHAPCGYGPVYGGEVCVYAVCMCVCVFACACACAYVCAHGCSV